jgi:hypothetical protein
MAATTAVTLPFRVLLRSVAPDLMLRLALCFTIAAFSLAAARHLDGAQPASSPAAATSAASPPPPATLESLINAMGSADVDQALQALKSNYINPDALNEAEIGRATLAGLLARLGRGVMLLPQQAPSGSDIATPFFAEILGGHVAYLRVGSLTPPNLQALDANLQSLGGKKVDALVLDLRATSTTNDFNLASELAKRFCPKGKPLFSLRKPGQKQERVFTSERDPAYQGLVIVLADGDTSGPAEAVAAVVRQYTKALIIGQPTAGRAVEFSDVNLNGGRMLRIAVAEAVLPDGRSLFAEAVKPDLPVELSATEKRQMFQESLTKGVSQFVFEAERPHMNEAALLAGRNPELEALEAAQRRGRSPDGPKLRDLVLQRAVDVVTSLAIYQQR